MLAYRPENEVSSIYKSYNFFPHTTNTSKKFNRFKKQLLKIRTQGYSLNHGEAYENT